MASIKGSGIGSIWPFGGEDTKRNLKHVKDRATNLAERPHRISSVTRITSTLRACANTRTFLRSARSCFAPEAVSFQTRRLLWPLGWEHINLAGGYHWDTSPTLGPDEFRPLRTHA